MVIRLYPAELHYLDLKETVIRRYEGRYPAKKLFGFTHWVVSPSSPITFENSNTLDELVSKKLLFSVITEPDERRGSHSPCCSDCTGYGYLEFR